ncbi:MAG: ATP-dependent zinc protease [Pseudomonadota bacterium]
MTQPEPEVPTAPAEPVPVAVVEPPLEIPLEDAVVIAEPPNACEVLYEQYAQTQPAIDRLEAQLLAQSELLADTVARLGDAGREATPLDCPMDASALDGDKAVIGGLEWIYMDPPERHFRARVDSGAETSSLSARDIVEFERDGEDWVRFVFEHDNANDPIELELPIVREALIRQASSEGLDRRFVVEIDVRLGDRLQRTEFTLTDRTRMSYPVLLGRAFLMDLYIVDVSQSYMHPRYAGP